MSSSLTARLDEMEAHAIDACIADALARFGDRLTATAYLWTRESHVERAAHARLLAQLDETERRMYAIWQDEPLVCDVDALPTAIKRGHMEHRSTTADRIAALLFPDLHDDRQVLRETARPAIAA